MDYLAGKQRIDIGSRIELLSNRLVIIVPKTSSTQKIKITKGFPLAELLSTGRLAMGDPAHVPAGIYGKQALSYLDVWEGVKHQIAPCKDVRTALVFVERGEAPLGLVYATDAVVSAKVRVAGYFPEESHSPIVCPVALVAGRQTELGRQFLRFLTSDPALDVFRKYGFSIR